MRKNGADKGVAASFCNLLSLTSGWGASSVLRMKFRPSSVDPSGFSGHCLSEPLQPPSNAAALGSFA